MEKSNAVVYKLQPDNCITTTDVVGQNPELMTRQASHTYTTHKVTIVMVSTKENTIRQMGPANKLHTVVY